MKTLIKAAEILARKGLHNTELDMVFFTMLEEGCGYAEALRAYAEYDGRSCVEIARVMEEAARDAGHWTGARYILERCYMEAIR